MNGTLLNERVLVCGGRDFDNYNLLADVLDVIRPKVLINGGARGADSLAKHWGELNSHVETYYAEWERLGRGAGIARNLRMLSEGKPTLVVAFKGGTGTKHMVLAATTAGVPVLKVLG